MGSNPIVSATLRRQVGRPQEASEAVAQRDHPVPNFV
jgi:hypothetical protein